VWVLKAAVARFPEGILQLTTTWDFKTVNVQNQLDFATKYITLGETEIRSGWWQIAWIFKTFEPEYDPEYQIPIIKQ
jgi:hypothetical protein